MRHLESRARSKKPARLLEEISIAAADFEQVAASQSTFLKIAHQALERGAQRAFLLGVARIGVSAFPAREVFTAPIRRLHRRLREPRIQVMNAAVRAAHDFE